MTASSINRKVEADIKAKKLERKDAIEKRKESENDKLEHQQIDVRGLSAETSDSDISIISEKAEAKPKKKTFTKKRSAKKA